MLLFVLRCCARLNTRQTPRLLLMAGELWMVLVRVSIAPMALATPLLLAGVFRRGPYLEHQVYKPLLSFFLIFPAIDYLVGRDLWNPGPFGTKWLAKLGPLLRSLPLFALPVQAAMLLRWCPGVLRWQTLTPLEAVVWVISVGVLNGALSITAAHELIHRSTRLERGIGGALLAGVCYGGFKVEHVRGHHVHVATPRDASSAARGQSLYHFWFQALRRNPRSAWTLEAARLQSHELGIWSWRNELLWWHGLSLLYGFAAFALYGLAGVAVFLSQSLVAILLLETVNYVEHYGLRRRQLENGRYEPVSRQHSWDSTYLLSNALIFQLQRHADHHARASRTYPLLQCDGRSPQLPGGYSAMILLAMFPPLWSRIIDPRIPGASSSGDPTAAAAAGRSLYADGAEA